MSSVTYTTIVAGVGDVEANTHVIDRACEMARLCDAALLLVAGFDPVSARDKARINEFAPVADVRVGLTEDQAYAVVEKARDIAVERGVALAQGVVVEGTAVDAVTLVTLETEADLVIVGSKGVDSLFGRIFGAVSFAGSVLADMGAARPEGQQFTDDVSQDISKEELDKADGGWLLYGVQGGDASELTSLDLWPALQAVSSDHAVQVDDDPFFLNAGPTAARTVLTKVSETVKK